MRTTKIHNRHTKNGPRPGARGVRQAAKVRILGRLRPEKPEHTGAAPRVWTVRTWKRPKAPADRKHRPGRILVGTASWTDPGFIADWYPAKLPPKERLGWYAQHFNLVEVNSSFYAVPAPEMTTRWCEQTPAGFVFDIKLHRLLSRHSTEAKLLPRDLRPLAGEGKRVAVTPKLETALVRRFLEGVAPLMGARKFGAFLLQLSPSFRPRENRLEELDHLLDLLSDYKVAVELRNRGWVEEDRIEQTTAYFTRHKATLVAVDAPVSTHFMVMPGLDLVTNPKVAYLRAHGRNERGYVRGRSVAERFDYKYSEEELEELAERAGKLAELTAETHVIFNNNKSNYAPLSARRFREIVAKIVPK